MKNLIPWNRRKNEIAATRQPLAASSTLTPIDRLFGDMLQGFDGLFSDVGLGLPQPAQARFHPRVDLSETAEEIRVEVEVPGLEHGDVQLELADGALVLRGEKRYQEESERGRLHASERYYGSFQRVIPLGCEVDEERIEARLDKGVLVVRLPKSEKARARTIQIENG